MCGGLYHFWLSSTALKISWTTAAMLICTSSTYLHTLRNYIPVRNVSAMSNSLREKNCLHVSDNGYYINHTATRNQTRLASKLEPPVRPVRVDANAEQFCMLNVLELGTRMTRSAVTTLYFESLRRLLLSAALATFRLRPFMGIQHNSLVPVLLFSSCDICLPEYCQLNLESIRRVWTARPFSKEGNAPSF